MGDEAFYAPEKKAPPARQPRPGEPLWSLRKNGRQYDCELRDHGTWGIEVQVYYEREFRFGQRCPSRELALAVADLIKNRHLGDGGVLIA